MWMLNLIQIGYPHHLEIYDAGDLRTTFVIFWKATAVFQFGLAVVWIAPMLYKNENQPDEHVRFLQAVGGESTFLHSFFSATFPTIIPFLQLQYLRP